MTVQMRTAEYVAEMLKMSVSEVHKRARSGEWECVQFSDGCRRWTDDQLAAIVARHTQPARTRPATAASVSPMRTRQARGPQRRSA